MAAYDYVFEFDGIDSVGDDRSGILVPGCRMLAMLWCTNISLGREPVIVVSGTRECRVLGLPRFHRVGLGRLWAMNLSRLYYHSMPEPIGENLVFVPGVESWVLLGSKPYYFGGCYRLGERERIMRIALWQDLSQFDKGRG